jgi:glutamate 5-kinase
VDQLGLMLKILKAWASQIDEIIKKNINVIIVSSGAIAEGMNRLGLKKTKLVKPIASISRDWSNGSC